LNYFIKYLLNTLLNIVLPNITEIKVKKKEKKEKKNRFFFKDLDILNIFYNYFKFKDLINYFISFFL